MLTSFTQATLVGILNNDKHKECTVFKGHIIRSSDTLASTDILMTDYVNGMRHVSELRPPMSLLFIPQVICERGEPW
jgi:hypothetical protein